MNINFPAAEKLVNMEILWSMISESFQLTRRRQDFRTLVTPLELSSFHASITNCVFVDVMSAPYCRTNYRNVRHLCSVSSAHLATVIVAVGNVWANNAHVLSGKQSFGEGTRHDNQSIHSLVSELCTGVVTGVLGAWCCVDCVGIPREARSGRGTALGVALDGGGLSWPTSKLAGGNPKSWDHCSLVQ